jgi:tetratricopeptide (TPR) repeat protein
MNNQQITQKVQILINQFKAQNFDLVISKGKALLKSNPEYVILYNLVGSSYQNKGKYLKAIKIFKEGLRLDFKNLALMNNLAMAYKNDLQYELAEQLYTEILKTNENYINAYVNFGNLKRDLNKFNDAIDLYEKALTKDKSNKIILYSLSLAHQGLGNFEKAISYAKDVLTIDENFTRADHLISQSKKYKTKDEHYLSLKEKLKKLDPKSTEKVDVYFSLAKAEEDLGNLEEASKMLIEGNNLKKKIINYNINDEINIIETVKKEFKKINFKTSLSKNNEKIIFILGMPRSGTSLVEQIVSSHSQVFGGGELPILSNIVRKNFFPDETNSIEEFNEKINDEILINQLKEDYLKYINNFKFNEKFISDKSPLNFRWIGFIKLIFPNSKIIHCTRDPKNNCLSMFKNLFEGGLGFTYDQKDLVKYYKTYLELMSFWKLSFDSTILDVKYEDLISNSKEEIKRIIDFCNLEWEEQCLEFHKNKTPIKTMSTAQARMPIYKSSLNPFEKFSNYFQILEKNL